MIKNVAVGTSMSDAICNKVKGKYSDILIVNNSANTVEVHDNNGGTIGSGIPILPASPTFLNSFRDRWNDRELFLIATGAGSDVRISVIYYPKSET